jgi:hypothetical protein
MALGERLLWTFDRHILVWPFRELYVTSEINRPTADVFSFQQFLRESDIQRMLHSCGLLFLTVWPLVLPVRPLT